MLGKILLLLGGKTNGKPLHDAIILNGFPMILKQTVPFS